MICVVLHCDEHGCDREQGYPLPTLVDNREGVETLFETALRLGAQYGWRHSLPDPEYLFDAAVFCPTHSGAG